MNVYRSRPQKKIYELQLLLMIRDYDRTHGHLGWPPTARNLFDLREHFAPSLTRIDTLRQWLLRHRGRVIRILPNCRPLRYELNRQGERRIALLQSNGRSVEDFKQEQRNAAERRREINDRQLYILKRRSGEIDSTDKEFEPLRKAIERAREVYRRRMQGK